MTRRRGAHITDFDVLRRIELPAVFHGVQQDFPKSGRYLLRFGSGQVGRLTIELQEAIGGEDIAADSRTRWGVADSSSMPSSQ